MRGMILVRARRLKTNGFCSQHQRHIKRISEIIDPKGRKIIRFTRLAVTYMDPVSFSISHILRAMFPLLIGVPQKIASQKSFKHWVWR